MLREAGLLTAGDLYDIHNVSLVHHVNQALRAHKLFAPRRRLHRQGRQDHHHRRVHRPHDGRPALLRGPAPGARGQGSVTVQHENQTLASITFQNYFRLYPKLAGMTGTAMTEADEFGEIYKLEVVEIPTNLPVHPQGRATTRSTAPRARSTRPSSTQITECTRARPAGAGRHGHDREVARRWRRC